jgi:hypothetical protein
VEELMNQRNILASGAALLLILGCGGGSGGGGATPRSTVKAIKLVYQAPDSTSWRLVQESSTGQHLVLDLMAPDGTTGQGFTVVLTTDPSNATWSTLDGSHYALQSLFPTAPPNVSQVSVSSSGADLRILFGQPQGTVRSLTGGPVVQVALDLLNPGATVGPVTLTAAAAGYLGSGPPTTQVTVAIGSLQAQ